MHGLAGLHSARAISRQRELRAKRKAERERRLSSRTDSVDSMDHPHPHAPHLQPTLPERRFGASVGMLHIGICFLALGLFFVGSGLLPEDYNGGFLNELVCTGLFVAALGVLLIVLNRIVSRKEEEDLNEYVQRQLTRSKSGHRLERDVETGCLATKNTKRLLDRKREDKECGDLPQPGSPLVKQITENPLQNGDMLLEKIEEVDEVGRAEIEMLCKETFSTTTTASPASPSETRELIANGRHPHHPRQL